MINTSFWQVKHAGRAPLISEIYFVFFGGYFYTLLIKKKSVLLFLLLLFNYQLFESLFQKCSGPSI